jgi:hypothetical protein
VRRVLAVGVIGMGLLAPGGSVASHNGGAAGERDFAVGSGSSEFSLGLIGEASFAISATSDPTAADPAGYVTSRGDPDGAGPMEPFTAQGEVTCLRVEGNRASVKWRLERATGSAAAFEGGGVQSFLEDNGSPRFGEPVDRAATDLPQPAPAFEPVADQCEDPDDREAAYDRLERGNVTVHDATPGSGSAAVVPGTGP